MKNKQTSYEPLRFLYEASRLRTEIGAELQSVEWRPILRKKSLGVIGTPLDGESPSSMLRLSESGDRGYIAHDNSIAHSKQVTSIAHETAHFLLKHDGIDPCEEFEAEVFALIMTFPTDSKKLKRYLQENPEMDYLLKTLCFVTLAGIGIWVLLSAGKGISGWVKNNKTSECDCRIKL